MVLFYALTATAAGRNTSSPIRYPGRMTPTTVFGAVRYLDAYRREGSHWRIAAREMRTVHAGSWDVAASSLTETLNVRWPGAAPAPSDCPRPRG